MILNADGTTADANHQALEILGVSREQLTSLPAGAAEWRAAERRLDEIPEGTAEWRAVRQDIDRFRSRYQAMFKP
jgi:PAS domain-containing protein